MPATPEIIPEPLPVLWRYWLAPLSVFHRKRSLALPPIGFVPPEVIPEPQKSLLVQADDMTPILAAHHGTPLQLEVLDREMGEHYLLRLVNLRRQDNLMVVECGAIGIQLSRFAPRVRALIEAGRIPLGAILHLEKVPHRGHPRGFFAVKAGHLVAHALGEPVGATLYGRCNELSFRDGISFANVVEILPRAS